MIWQFFHPEPRTELIKVMNDTTPIFKVIQQNLSDAKAMIDAGSLDLRNKAKVRIAFVQLIISHYPDSETKVNIKDLDSLYDMALSQQK